MFSTWKWNSTSPTQVIKGIDDVLDAILDPQTVKMELLAHEERSSFMNEYSSLAHTRSGLSKGTTKYIKLVEVLGQCEALKQRIQMACRRHREDEIRRGGQASPETSSTHRQSIESGLSNTAPSFISDHFNSVTTNGNSFHTAPMSQQNTSTISCNSYHTASTGTGAPASAGSFNMPATQQSPQTSSRTSTISTDSQSASLQNEKDCMVFDANSTTGSPTFNVDSDGATGSTHTYGSGSPSRMIPQARQQPAARVYQSQTARIVKREGVMYFGPGSTTDSPTYNIRSQNASGTIVSYLSAET